MVWSRIRTYFARLLDDDDPHVVILDESDSMTQQCEHVEDGQRCDATSTVTLGLNGPRPMLRLCAPHYQQRVRELRVMLGRDAPPPPSRSRGQGA
jgi:hypothetical protein